MIQQTGAGSSSADAGIAMRVRMQFGRWDGVWQMTAASAAIFRLIAFRSTAMEFAETWSHSERLGEGGGLLMLLSCSHVS